MDLRQALLAEHSKRKCERIARYIGNDPERFAQLMELILHGEPLMVQRAVRVIGIIGEICPHLLVPHLAALICRTREAGIHDAVKRNVLRALQFTDLPETIHGEVLGTCLDFLADPAERPAIHANAMTVLGRLAAVYPEIRNELDCLLACRWETASPAFRTRARQLRAQLDKEKDS